MLPNRCEAPSLFEVPGDNVMGAICAALAEQGYAALPGFISSEARAQLASTAMRLFTEGEVQTAGIGREAMRDQSIRKTALVWIERGPALHDAFLDWCDGLRHAINQQTFLGLFEFEAHYALYPEGGFYARHRDSFAGARNRTVSFVLYLNEDWQPGWGGALSLFDGETDAVRSQVLPAPGGAVFMMSESQWHAVEVTRKPRLAIAGWWRVNQSVPGRADPPQ